MSSTGTKRWNNSSKLSSSADVISLVCTHAFRYNAFIPQQIGGDRLDHGLYVSHFRNRRLAVRVLRKPAADSLSDLYDPDLTPLDLLKAHPANDRAVMQAYGMSIKETDEAACVAWLMRLYQEKISEIEKR